MKKYNKEALTEELKNIELLCLDIDGTLTDGGMYLDDKGGIIKKFYAHDGTGLQMVKHLGVKLAILTTSVSPLIDLRAKQLSIDYIISGSKNKGKDILELCIQANVSPAKTIHMGDDVNDIVAFTEVGYPIGVHNSSQAINSFVCYTTEKDGGKGAVREICDLILFAKTGKLYGPPYV